MGMGDVWELSRAMATKKAPWRGLLFLSGAGPLDQAS